MKTRLLTSQYGCILKELWMIIFEFCGPQYVCTCLALVNSSFYKLSQSQFLWKQFCYNRHHAMKEKQWSTSSCWKVLAYKKVNSTFILIDELKYRYLGFFRIDYDEITKRQENGKYPKRTWKEIEDEICRGDIRGYLPCNCNIDGTIERVIQFRSEREFSFCLSRVRTKLDWTRVKPPIVKIRLFDTEEKEEDSEISAEHEFCYF